VRPLRFLLLSLPLTQQARLGSTSGLKLDLLQNCKTREAFSTLPWFQLSALVRAVYISHQQGTNRDMADRLA
jgi:hypothetical protein